MVMAYGKTNMVKQWFKRLVQQRNNEGFIPFGWSCTRQWKKENKALFEVRE